MQNKLIQAKIEELRLTLEQELEETVVSYQVTFTGTMTHKSIEHKYPDQLKRENISMRNVKGEFIR